MIWLHPREDSSWRKVPPFKKIICKFFNPEGITKADIVDDGYDESTDTKMNNPAASSGVSTASNLCKIA
jgi:hypothetical protein